MEESEEGRQWMEQGEAGWWWKGIGHEQNQSERVDLRHRPVKDLEKQKGQQGKT